MNKMINGLGSLFQTNGKSQANKIEINYLIYQHSQTEVCQRRTHNSENKVCCKKRKFLESKRRKKNILLLPSYKSKRNKFNNNSTEIKL